LLENAKRQVRKNSKNTVKFSLSHAFALVFLKIFGVFSKKKTLKITDIFYGA